MNRNRLKPALLALLALGLAPGCDNEDEDRPDPPSVNLNAQVDRMARAGINTAAANAPFADAATNAAARDDYNRASSPASWAQFSARTQGNLAILDSLDASCGNQLLAGAAAVPGRYSTLAGVLVEDRLYVNTATGTCTQYLAVEANAVGVPFANDCGGRTPNYDTIDVTYSVVAIGQLSGVDDGVPRDADGTHSTSQFPYLDEPN